LPIFCFKELDDVVVERRELARRCKHVEFRGIRPDRD